MKHKYLHLDLDELYEEGYYYTDYDIGGEGHGITIKVEDKEAFLDAFAAQWRKNTEEMLVGLSDLDGVGLLD